MTEKLVCTLTLVLFASVGLAGCASPPPTCSASETGYDICSDNQIWECLAASDEELAEKQALIDGCSEADDPVACQLDLEFEMFETELKADCRAAGQVCSEDPFDGPPECEDP